MDLEFRGSNPLTYIVGEHARAVLAIQDLQREVNALLNFRDYVLHALPHLKSRGPADGVSSESTTQVAPHSTVVDSGFSTDKASTSIGKSSSFSGGGGETCGESRWDHDTDHDATETPEEIEQPPLGSCEDELWQLLEVIQRKGTRLRGDLERAEMSEREHLPSAACDGGGGAKQHKSQQDFWPHSLPPPSPGQRYDYYGFEPFVEMDRLRLDRSYLLSRISKAETEAAVSHSRLIDLHTQMMGLTAEKRRLEDALHVTVQDAAKIDSYLGYHHLSTKHMTDHVPRLGRQRSSVTVNSSESHYPPNPAWIDEDIMLPRILKVPIRDKGEDRTNTSKPKESNYSTVVASKESPGKLRGANDPRDEPGFAQHSNYPKHTDGSSPQRQTTVSHIGARGPHTERVVIERQRACSKVDGGLSMPTSLLKGNKIKVNPDKQRISAILREKDVLTLQKQLLTTVMETEVLKRQLECCSEEWTDKCSQFEEGQKKNCDMISSLAEENRQLKHRLDRLKNVSRTDFGATAKPATKSVAVSTDPHDDAHQPASLYETAPANLNVKYDVVVHEEAPVPKPSRPLEKPPRKRAGTSSRVSSCGGSDVTFASTARECVTSPRVNSSSGSSRSYPKTVAISGTRTGSSSTPNSSLTNRHSRTSSGSVAPVRREATARSGSGPGPPPASLRSQQPFNKVPFLSHSTLAFSGVDSILHKPGPAEARSESFIPRATPKLGYFNAGRERHLPKSPSSGPPQSKYMPIDKSPRSYVRYTTSPHSSGSGIPSLIRGYVKSESPKLINYSEEPDQSYCSADEDATKRTADASRQKTLWRKSSGAIRIRTVGRPSVMSYLGKESSN